MAVVVGLGVGGAAVAGMLPGQGRSDLLPGGAAATSSPPIDERPFVTPAVMDVPPSAEEEAAAEAFQETGSRPVVAPCGAPETAVTEAGPDVGLSVRMDIPVPTAAFGRLDVVATVSDTTGDTVEVVHHGVGLVLTAGGRVVGHGAAGGVPSPGTVEPGSSSVTGDAPFLVACDEGPMVPGRYTAWPVVDVTLPAGPGDRAASADADGFGSASASASADGEVHLLVGDPVEVTVPTSDAPAQEALPAAVPVRLDRLLEVSSTSVPPAWHALGEMGGGREAATEARTALVDAGFAPLWEQRLGHRYWGGLFRGHGLLVGVSVENWTGGGFYGEYRVLEE